MKRRYLLLTTISMSVILVDQISKALVLAHLNFTESREVIAGFFNFTYYRNPGAAFSMFASAGDAFRRPFFIAVPIIAVVAILAILRNFSDKDRLQFVGLSLVTGGAIGNLIDRIRFDYVVDFLDFHWGSGGPHFAIFNIADFSISVGVVFLILDMILRDFVKKKDASA